MKRRRTRGLVKSDPGALRVFARRHLVPSFVWNRVHQFVKGPAKSAARVDELQAKLWHGFSEQALRDLDALLTGTRSTPREVHDAARALGAWYASHEEYSTALDYAIRMREAGRGKHSQLQVMLEADCLMQVGERDRARRILSDAIARKPSTALYLAMANTHARPEGSISDSEDEERLYWLNEVYRAHGLHPVEKLDATRPLTLDNLGAPNPALKRRGDQPKISVIVPTHDAANTLHIAITSLLGQTWTDLEILVVDDKSSDDSIKIAQEFSRLDSRIVVLEQPSNRGAYAARNLGLEHATGKFVTVHDADDWSHPQKLEKQVLHLMKGRGALGNLSLWSRCSPHLYFRGATRATRPWVHYNHSSLLLERELLASLGGWDEVRVGADSELLRRLRHGQTEERVPRVFKSAPLALALSLPTSLTRQSITHADTLLHGVRRTYYEASLHWLEKQPSGPVKLPSGLRPFPAPAVILPDRVAKLEVDAVFVLDFNVDGAPFEIALQAIRSSLGEGKSVGVFQWSRYEQDVTRPLRAEVLELAQAGSIEVISAGQRCHVDTLVVTEPRVLQHAIDRPPDFDVRRFIVLQGSSPTPLGQAERDRATDVVRRLFRVDPTWQTSFTP